MTATAALRPLRVMVSSRGLAEQLGAVPAGVELVGARAPSGGPRALLASLSRARPDVIVHDARTATSALALLKTAGWRGAHLGATTARRARLVEAVLAGHTDPAGWEPLLDGLAAAAGRPGAHRPGGPPVSVVSTVLDEEANVEHLLAQVGAQLRDDDELVVVDGGSRDGTVAALEAHAARDPRIRVIQAPGTNISAGRNIGIDAAAHAVIATTDAGCSLGPDWLEALRAPFAATDAPGLVAGNCSVNAETPLELAQAVACYPDPHENERPALLVGLYGKLFGTVFDPTLPFARSLAFTKDAWRDAGGFPEDVGWTEDGVFGRSVAEHHACVFAADARVSWDQHATIRSTYRMYNRYGRGAAVSGSRQLVARDAARAVAYAVGAAAVASRNGRAVAAVGAGGALYVSLPLWRAARRRTGPRAAVLIPVAMALKDLGKVSGALTVYAGRG
jgi:glycosyltransferase involved in cell wall biosynthesis